MKPVLGLVALACAAASCLQAACPALVPGQKIQGPTNLLPPCYAIDVTRGQPLQLVIEQGEDLAMKVSGDGQDYLVDGFEFGRESVTLAHPGQYTIAIQPAAASVKGLGFTITCTPVSNEMAALWRKAEELSTSSKRSGDPKEIAESRRLWMAVGDSSSIARTQLKAGDAILLADPAGAREMYEQALTLCESGNDSRCVAEASNNSGVAAERGGDFDAALLLLRKAADAWRQLSHPADEGTTRGNIGVLYRRIGAYSDALTAMEDAEVILQKVDRLAHASVLNSLGICYLELAKTEESRMYFEAAIREAEPFANATYSAQFEANLGQAFLSGGNAAQAKRVLADALEKAEKQPQRGLRGYVLNLQGQAELQLDNRAQARDRLDRALLIHQDIKDTRGQANDLHYLGLLAQLSGQLDNARDFLTKAVQLRRDRGLRSDLASSLYGLASVERQTGNLNRAQDLGEEALKLLESLRTQVPSAPLRAGLYSRQRRLFDLTVDIAMAPGTANAAVQGLLAADRGRGRALMDLLTANDILGRIPSSLLVERTATERRIDYVSAQLAAAKPPRDVTFRKQLETLLTKDDSIMARIHNALSDLPFSTPLTSIESLQHDVLPPNSALLQFHLGSPHSYLWFVDRNGVRVFPLPGRMEIERLVQPAANALEAVAARQQSSRKRVEFAAQLKAMSEILLGPLVGTKLPQRVILAPDGVLLRAAFAALTAPGETQPLGLKHDLVQVPSAAFLVAARKPRPIGSFPKTILALYDPVFTSDDGRLTLPRSHSQTPGGEMLDRLPFGDDIDVIRALTPPGRREILSDFDVSRTRLYRMQLSDFDVLHFSTHAVIDDVTPEISRVVLSLVDRNGRTVDGYLRPYQLSQLHLNGSIVVLSACDTALGKEVSGEGLAGFASSLFEAGASQLVLSLAKVDGKPSARFFAEVYRAFLSGKRATMEHSLASARRWMASSNQWSDPYYWASFIVMGQPTSGL